MLTINETMKRAVDSVQPALAFDRVGAADPAAWRRKLRRRLLETLRIAPRPGPAPAVEEQGCEQMDGYRRHKILIENREGAGIPCYVLVPDGLKRRAPACLAVHGHGPGKRLPVGIGLTDDERRLIAEDRDYAVQAVRRGMIALAPDMRGFGEFMLKEDETGQGRNGCYQLACRLSQLGKTLLGERVLDLMRCVDYLAARPDVHPRRIVMTGNSGGGTATLFTMAVDRRIAAAAPSCYFCTFRDSILAMFHCLCNFVPGLSEVAEMADIAGLFAPRPLLVIAGRDDGIFPLRGVEEAFARLAAIYEALGARDRLELFVGPGGHRFYRDRVWDFFMEHLGRRAR